VADDPFARLRRELTAETGQHAGPARAVVGPLADEDLRGDDVAQALPRRLVQRARDLGGDAQDRGEIDGPEAVAAAQVEDLPIVGRQAPRGVPRHHPQVRVVSGGDHRGGLLRAAPLIEITPYALPPSECVQPRLQPTGVGERVNMGLGGDERAEECRLGGAGGGEHRTAVSVDAFRVCVVEIGEGSGTPRTQSRDQGTVSHVIEGKRWVTMNAALRERQLRLSLKCQRIE